MQFFFEQEAITTLDEKVQVVYSTDGSMTALAKNGMLALDEGRLYVQEQEALSACYTFVERWVPFENIEVAFDICIEQLGAMDLLSFKHGGYVRLTPGVLTVHLVTERGEFTAELAGEWNFLGPALMRLERSDDRIGFEIGGMNMHIDIPDNCRDGLEIRGLLGEISGTEARIGAIFMQDVRGIPDEQRIGQHHQQ